MSAPADTTVLRALLFKGRADDGQVVKCAYSTEETIAAFGPAVSRKAVKRLIQRGDLPTRNTGRQYFISGAVIIDVLGRRPEGINDPREVIEPERLYFLKDLATFLGVSYGIAHRLTQGKTPDIDPDRSNGRFLIPGSTILEYLAGHDDPLRATA